MGVPRQVMEAEQENDKELEAEVAVTPPQEAEPEKAEEPEVQPEAPAEPPKKSGILASVGAERSDFDQREKSAQGRLHALQGQRKADLEEWKRREQSYQSQIADLNAKIEELKRPREDVDDIREEFGENYSQEDVERFARAVDRRVERHLRSIKDRLDKNDADKEEAVKAAAVKRAEQFKADLEAEFPGFSEMDASNDARWIGFLDTSLGGVMEGTTYGDVAKRALETLDYRKFASVVREFAKQSGIVFSSNGNARVARSADIRPQSMPGSRGQQQPRVFPRSEVEHFRRLAYAHKAESAFNLNSQQVREILSAYEDAEADGRIAENR